MRKNIRKLVSFFLTLYVKIKCNSYKGKIKVKYNLNYEEVEELINKGDTYNNSNGFSKE